MDNEQEWDNMVSQMQESETYTSYKKTETLEERVARLERIVAELQGDRWYGECKIK